MTTLRQQAAVVQAEVEEVPSASAVPATLSVMEAQVAQAAAEAMAADAMAVAQALEPARRNKLPSRPLWAQRARACDELAALTMLLTNS